VVAFTVVALGTSLPELVVTLQATLTGYPGIVLGNVVGSNIANVLLVGGAAAMVYPLALPKGNIQRDSGIMMGVSILFALICVFGELTWRVGLLLLAGMAAVLTLSARDAVQAHGEAGGEVPTERVLGLPTQRRLITVFIVLGLIGLPLGARLVVQASVELATHLGVSETLVGLTILAFGTSLPELATTVVAAYKKETDVAIGTIVGSNIFNLMAIMGVASALSSLSIHVPEAFAYLDFPVMLASALAVTLFVWLGRPVGKKMGIVMFTAYVVYMGLLVVRS
jgi:cation:H+ antiporter